MDTYCPIVLEARSLRLRCQQSWFLWSLPPGLQTVCLFGFSYVLMLEKTMATHSSTLAWKIPWEEPGRLQSTGSLRVGHDWAASLHFHALEKEMATHSRVLAWRILGMGEPGGLPSMGSHRVGHDWSELAAAAAACSHAVQQVKNLPTIQETQV